MVLNPDYSDDHDWEVVSAGERSNEDSEDDSSTSASTSSSSTSTAAASAKGNAELEQLLSTEAEDGITENAADDSDTDPSSVASAAPSYSFTNHQDDQSPPQTKTGTSPKRRLRKAMNDMERTMESTSTFQVFADICTAAAVIGGGILLARGNRGAGATLLATGGAAMVAGEAMRDMRRQDSGLNEDLGMHMN